MIALVILGVVLILNGVANIVDDGRVLTYDITSVLAGIGFILVSRKQASVSKITRNKECEN